MDGFFRETLSQTYLDNIKKILRLGQTAASLRPRKSSKRLKFRILSGEIQGFTCERDYHIMAHLSKRKRDPTAEDLFPLAKKQAASKSTLARPGVPPRVKSHWLAAKKSADYEPMPTEEVMKQMTNLLAGVQGIRSQAIRTEKF